jgi:hypothetical protein
MTIRGISVTFLQIGIVINIRNWVYYYIRIGEKSTNPYTTGEIDQRFIDKYFKEEADNVSKSLKIIK